MQLVQAAYAPPELPLQSCFCFPQPMPTGHCRCVSGATNEPRAMKKPESTPLKQAMRAARPSLIMTGVFSLFINLLMLAGPLYMLQVYDRVLPSSSVDTLIALSALLLGLFIVTGCLEFVRSRILSRVATQLETRVAPGVFDAAVRKRVAEPHDEGDESLNELGGLRDFLSGNALPAFFDMPWVPIYLAILTILHPVLGLLGLVGALFLLALACMNNGTTRAPMMRYAAIISPGRAIAQASQKNAEVLQAMGMVDAVRRSWLDIHSKADVHKSRATEWSGLFSVTSKTSRLLLQSAALGVGAALVITDDFSAGAMIAGTIILGRGLAPVDQSIAHWRSYVSAKASYARLEKLLTCYPEAPRRLSQPAAHRTIDVESVYAGPPGARKAVVSGINFSIVAGEALAIIGPSACGKSTLARLLAGVWMPQAGTVRLDGVALDQWNGEERGRQIGYLPQDVELFDGTVAQNIARFQGDATDMEIVAAAEAAGVHEMILQLGDGYETLIGEAGRGLSGGQRQRLGLARALFRDPFLVILDEPNANLDADGDLALIAAVNRIRDRGGIAIVITHRPGFIEAVDKALVLNNGRQQAVGPVSEVLARTTQMVPAVNSNITSISTAAAV